MKGLAQAANILAGKIFLNSRKALAFVDYLLDKSKKFVSTSHFSNYFSNGYTIKRYCLKVDRSRPAGLF